MYPQAKDGELPSSAALGDTPTPGAPDALLETFLDPFIAVDRTGTITGWNTQATSAFGWTHAEAIGRALCDLLAPSSQAAFEEALAKLFDLASSATARRWIEATVVHRDGHEFPVEMSFFPARSGEVCHIGILAGQLARQREIDSQAEQKFRSLTDQFPVPLVEVDLRGNYLYANQAYYDTYNVKTSRTGASYKSLMDPIAVAECRATFGRVYKTGQPATSEYRITPVDRPEIWAENSVSLRKDAAGTPVGFISISHDATRRKQYEEELAEARQAAEAGSRAKSEFLASMSHEIRTPLNGVLGMLELARSTDLDPEQKDLLGMAQDSANSLLAVLNDILDFSKIEAGKLEFEHARFDLPQVVAEAMRTLAIRAHEKRLELACEFAPGVPQYVLGDQARLKQVLINLTGNAIKFTEHGEVLLKVERFPKEIESGSLQLKFSVSDTGIGIAEEKQQLIFGAFSQADASTTRKYGGTGLGLAICTRIVKLMGGEIGVVSLPGAGSTFHFTAGFEPGAGECLTTLANRNAELTGLPVLIVDDSATNRRILETLLASWGMSPITAATGAEALEILQRSAAAGKLFPVALLDFQMPEMNGFQLAQQIRNRFAYVPASIMLLTSDGYTGSAQRCRQAGIAAYLMKPVKQSDLMDSLLALLRPDRPETPVLTKPQDQEEQIARQTILLAEDNLVNQKLTAQLLHKLGHNVVVATTGREVLQKLEERSFDLVLMDVQMPDMDGLAATAAIRKREHGGSHLPIIAMTAHAMAGDRRVCLDAGMDDYIAKPINFEQVRQAINQVIRAKNLPEPARIV